MTDNLKVYYPDTIVDSPLPGQEPANFGISQATSGGSFSTEKATDQSMPTKRVAIELLSSALNTKSKKILAEFTLTEQGALQIGKYVNGVSGDIRLTPSGIVMRDKSGITTVAQYAEDGSAVFKGSIQAGSIITGLVIVGNNSLIFDGDNKRILVNDGENDIIAIGNLDF